MLHLTCLKCGKNFDRINKGKNKANKYCFHVCYWAAKRPTFTGANNPRWVNGSYVSTQGYRMIASPLHPRVLATGYVPEQVLTVEGLIGRFLRPEEVVHHINQVKTDNRPENLYLFPNQREHARHHQNLLLGKEQRKVSNLL